MPNRCYLGEQRRRHRQQPRQYDIAPSHHHKLQVTAAPRFLSADGHYAARDAPTYVAVMHFEPMPSGIRTRFSRMLENLMYF